MAIQVKSNMSPYLDATLTCIKEALSVKGRQRKEVETATFSCISMLATAVGQALTKYLHDLLELMFNGGLSEPLVAALSNIADRIKPLSPVIQGKRNIHK